MSSSQVTQTATAKTEDSSFLLKLSKFLAVTIIFFSATQLGLHFWPASSLVYGIRIDYLSPTLYFIDCLILLYLFLRRFLNWRPEQSSSLDAEGGRRLLIGTFLPLLLTNLLYSQNPLATLSWSLHLALYYFFIVFLGSDLKKIIATTITLSLLFQTIVATTQVYLGHSLDGLMYYLGERMVSVGSPGIALGAFIDQVVLRAYGTFSHPNILAGYAVISLLIILRLSPQFRSLRDFRRVIRTIAIILTALLVFLSQSRAAAISLFGIIIPFYLLKNLKPRLIYFVFIFSLLTFLPAQAGKSSLLTPTRSDLSSAQRLTLQSLSWSVIKTYPVFGTGAQASISTYPQINSSVRILQPDHNSFTLFLSWFGIFGLIGVLYALRPTTHGLRHIFPLIPLLLFDHYLLTSPQGVFILCLYLGATPPVLNYINAQKNS